MKALPWVLGVAGAGLLVTAVGLGIWAGMPANPLATLWILISQAGPLSKLAYLLLTGVAIWIGLLAPRPSRDPSALMVLGLLAPGLGLAASLMAGLTIRIVMVQTHTTELMVIAPSLAEALAPFSIGLLLGAVALALKAKAATGAEPAPA